MTRVAARWPASLRANGLRGVANGDGQRRRQAALPGAAESAVGDDLRGRGQVGVRQHDDRVLGAALALRALAVGGAARVDIAAP